MSAKRSTSWRNSLDAAALPLAVLGGVVVIGRNVWRLRHESALAQRLASERSQQRAPLAASRRVSMLVAAWNEADLIERHIESVLSLRYPDLEYVVAAGGRDGTYSLALRYERPAVTVLRQEAGEGKQRALRRCLERASGSVLFLTDADCLLDDDSFERTLEPVLLGVCEAATGGSRPLPEQIGTSVLVDYRWSVDTYVDATTPAIASGLLGRNAAVLRSSVDATGGFSASVPSGTDYHLARALIAQGSTIRHVRASEVATRYETHLGAYAHRQRRWLRNVVLWGRTFGAHDAVAASLRSSAVGATMLALPPAALLIGKAALSLWALALLHASLSKIRYIAFAAALHRPVGPTVSWKLVLAAAPLSLLEFAVSVLPLLDYLVPSRRSTW